MTDRRPELEALVEKKGKPLHLYALAMEYRKFGELDKALKAFSNVLEKDAAYHPALFMAAQIHADEGRRNDAIAALERGISIAEAEGDGHAVSEMRSLLEEVGEEA